MTSEFPQATDTKYRFFYGYIIIAAAFVIMLAVWSSYYAFGVFFKPVMNEFGWTRTMTSGAFALSLLLGGVLAIPAGQITDRLGTRPVMTACGILLGSGYMLMFLTHSLWQFYLFYGIIIGVGMGGGIVPMASVVVRWFTLKRGIMTGIVFMGNSLGALIGPPLANWLITMYDWHTAYLLLGGIVLVVIVLAAQLLRRDPTRVGQLPYGGSRDEKQIQMAPPGMSLKEAVHTSQFWLFSLSLVAVGYTLFVFAAHIVPHATDLGFSPTAAAITLSAFGVGGAVGRLTLGGVADWLGNKRAFVISLIVNAVAFLLLVKANQLWSLYLVSGILGLAQGGLGVSQPPLTADLFGIKAHALIMGVVGIGVTIGATIGPVLSGYMFDTTSNYWLAFLVSALIGVAGVVLAVMLKPLNQKERPLS